MFQVNSVDKVQNEYLSQAIMFSDSRVVTGISPIVSPSWRGRLIAGRDSEGRLLSRLFRDTFPDPSENVPEQVHGRVRIKVRGFVVVLLIGCGALLIMFEAIDVGIRFAVPPEIPAGRVVVVKHKVRWFARIRTGTPFDPQGCVVRINSENQRIERDLKFSEPTVISLSASCDIDRGMVPDRSHEFS